MKKTVIAVLLAALASSAFAAEYFVVVPVPNKSPSVGNILVSLSGYTLPAGVVGRAYAGFDFNSVLQVQGDPNFSPSNVTWSVVGGALPAGLSLGADGKLTGTPTAAASASLEVQASYKSRSGIQTYQVVIAQVNIALSGSLPPGVQGRAYLADLKSLLSVTGDPAYTPQQVRWSVVSGALPAGIVLNADGTLSGTPSAGGTTPVTFQASYLSAQGQQTYQLVVAQVTISLSGGALPAGTQNQSYSVDVKPYLSEAGDPSYSVNAVSWSVIGGALPGGLALNGDGTISGTPNSSGNYSFEVQASYQGLLAPAWYSLSMNPAGYPDGQVTASDGSNSFYGWGPDAAPVVDKQFSFTNTGPVAANGLYAYATTGAPANGSSFYVVSSNCGTSAAPITLPAGATCTFVAEFNGGSTQGGSGSGSVGVTWSGPNTGSRSMAVTGLTEYD